MGVAVLHPQDSLRNSSYRQPIISPLPKTDPKSTQTNRSHPKRSKRSGRNPARPESYSDGKPLVNDKLVMGQVKILKRGEQLPGVAANRKSETIEKLDPAPTDTVVGLYAGSSMFVASPPPSSVPFPAFVTKKIAIAAGDATSDLRRMLRLDFS